MKRAIRRMRKQLLMIACIALVCGLAIGGTIAWLVSESNQVENTFSVGDLEIVLKEKDLITEEDKQEGEVVGELRDSWVEKNTYSDIVPGDTVKKNPTVFVEDGSEDSFIFVCVKNNVAVASYVENGTKKEESKVVASYSANSAWKQVGETYLSEDKATEMKLFVYNPDNDNDGSIVSIPANFTAVTFSDTEDAPKYYQVPTAVFETVKIDGTFVTEDNINNLTDDKITVYAYAHQATNTDITTATNAAEAWFDELCNPTTTTP